MYILLWTILYYAYIHIYIYFVGCGFFFNLICTYCCVCVRVVCVCVSANVIWLSNVYDEIHQVEVDMKIYTTSKQIVSLKISVFSGGDFFFVYFGGGGVWHVAFWCVFLRFSYTTLLVDCSKAMCWLTKKKKTKCVNSTCYCNVYLSN